MPTNQTANQVITELEYGRLLMFVRILVALLIAICSFAAGVAVGRLGCQ